MSVGVHMLLHACATEYAEDTLAGDRRRFAGVIPLLPHVSPRDHTRVARLGNKYPYLPSHPANLSHFFFFFA